MQRPLVAKATQRGQRVETWALERVGTRTVGDEDDYRHANRGDDDDMRRRKAARARRGKSRREPLVLAGV